MRDIDGIQRRLTQLETAVSLSMLEEKTETLQVLDDEGFDRFKSGFVVDPFKGHGVGRRSSWGKSFFSIWYCPLSFQY